MAKLKNDSFIQSPQFTFFVGHEGKAITVHAEAIAATSAQLNALINGGMKESESRCAKLEDVEVDDFVRFCEYAYRGDYTVPPWEDRPSIPHPPSDDLGNFGFGSSSKTKKKKMKKGSMIEPYPETPYVDHQPEEDPVEMPSQYAVEVPVSRTELRNQFNTPPATISTLPKALILDQFEPKGNSAVHQDFTPIFLAHARLYCFAHQHLIEPLKALTINKLQKTLMGFQLYKDRVGDIVELARFVYSNPDLPESSDQDVLNDLKKLIAEYIACEIDVIGKHESFIHFIEEGGEFVRIFWKIVRQFIE
jgi:hypothetical protein